MDMIHRDFRTQRFAMPPSACYDRKGKERCLLPPSNLLLSFCLSLSMACLPCLRPPLFPHAKFDSNNGPMKAIQKLSLLWKWRTLPIGSSQPFSLGLPSSASSQELLVAQRLPRDSPSISVPSPGSVPIVMPLPLPSLSSSSPKIGRASCRERVLIYVL